LSLCLSPHFFASFHFTRPLCESWMEESLMGVPQVGHTDVQECNAGAPLFVTAQHQEARLPAQKTVSGEHSKSVASQGMTT
jgi:hypothetical protein